MKIGPNSAPNAHTAPSAYGSRMAAVANAAAAQIQNDPMITNFACRRRCTHGATSDPAIAPPPKKASMRPIVAEDAPSCFARTISARMIALNAKFEPATRKTAARRNGCRHNQVTPSAISVRNRVGVRSRTSWNAGRTNSSDTKDTAYESASAANGSRRLIPKRTPPSG